MAVVLSVVGNVDLKQLKQAEAAIARLAKKAEAASVGPWSKAFDTMGNKMQTAGAKMESAGKRMTMSLTLPIVAIGGYAVKTAMEFETAMNQVQAATEAPADEMERLSELAKQLGADTVFSAGEAANAMLELAKAGITPAQISAGALDAALRLAAAGGVSLEAAATTTANALNMFGLEAKQAGEVANAMAGGANASSASVESLQQALSQVGPGARNAGLSLQQTVGVLAAFADKGIQGSDAGTSLKTMLQRLIPQTDKAADAMKKYGLTFVDAKGDFDDIETVAGKLQDKLGGLSEAQRAQALQTIFGSDATRAATVLMQEGTKGIEKYVAATNDQNAAQAMADARMKGMAGAIEQLKGSAETAAITFGQALAPRVIELAGTLKDLADKFAALTPGQQEMIIKAALLVAAMGPVLSITGKVTSALGGMVKGIGFTIKTSAQFIGGLKGAATASSSLAGKAGLLAKKLGSVGDGSLAAQAGLVVMAAAVGFAIGTMISNLPAVEKWRGDMVAAIDDAAASGEKLSAGVNGWEQPLTWAYSKVAEGAYKAAGAGKANGMATDAMAAKYRELGIELDANGTITERGIAQMREHVKALASDTSSVRGLAFATRDMAAATLAAKTASEASSNAELTMLQSRQAVKSATQNLTTAIRTYGKGSDEARIATLQLEQANGAAAKATDDYKKKAAEAKKVNDELAKQTALEKKLEALRAAWSKVAIATDNARSAAQRYLALNVQDSQHKTAGIQKARGGINPGFAQRITWGEDGPEAIIPLSAKYRSDAMNVLSRVVAVLGLNLRSMAGVQAPSLAAPGGGSMSLSGLSSGVGRDSGGVVFGPGSIVVQGVAGMDVVSLAKEVAYQVIDKIARERKRR